jgi:cell division protein FtsB
VAARRTRRRIPRRVLAVGVVLLVAFLYWRPVAKYVDTRRSVERRQAEVRSLRAEKADLQRRLAVSASPDALSREARRLGLVRPGQHLYIVKGIRRWLRDHRGTLDPGGR